MKKKQDKKYYQGESVHGRSTVGKLSSDLLQKEGSVENVVDIQREIQEKEDYLNSLVECVDVHKKLWDTDFYVSTITKKERLLVNTLRNYTLATRACPTPTWDQSVYKYYRNDQKLEYLWTVPDKDTCEYLAYYQNQVVPEERQLLEFVLKFHDGTLMKYAKQLNGEEPDTIFIA